MDNKRYLVGIFKDGRLLTKLFDRSFDDYKTAALVAGGVEAAATKGGVKLPEGLYVACAQWKDVQWATMAERRKYA